MSSGHIGTIRVMLAMIRHVIRDKGFEVDELLDLMDLNEAYEEKLAGSEFTKQSAVGI
ncbi:hypothetical protein AX16_010275 [Volvariella volvacea WC 439]|nr:hypothetical protein AX16_010275 [Volvariella volvacea WC 439]